MECQDATIVPFKSGQYLIQDDGKLFYDPTTGTTVNDRIIIGNYWSVIGDYTLEDVVAGVTSKCTIEINDDIDYSYFKVYAGDRFLFMGDRTNNYFTSASSIFTSKYVSLIIALPENRLVKYFARLTDRGHIEGDLGYDLSDMSINTVSYTSTNDGVAYETDYLTGIDNPRIGDCITFTRTQTDVGVFTRTYEYTSDKKWQVVHRNNLQDEVVFDSDIIVTTAIGNIKLTNGKGTIPAKGKTPKEVWEAVFSQDKNPTVTQPSASIKMGYGSNAVDTTARSFEVGTSITPKWAATFSAGSYSYGPATGVAVSSWKVTDTLSHSSTAASGSFAAFIINAGQTYKITAVATHTAGAIPKTALEKDYPSGKIAAGTKTATSQSYTGYRQGYFIGSLTSKVANASLTSAQIRTAAKKRGGNYVKESVTWTIPVGAATVFIAWPASSTGPTKILNTTVNADMTAAFGSPVTVKVAGADGSTSSSYAADYKVISYRPDSAYTTAANLTITMG